MRLHIFVALAFLSLAAASKSYDGYMVYRTAVLDASYQGKLDHLMARPEFDFWNMPRVGRQIDILVSPQHAQELEVALGALGLHPTVVNHNVGYSVQKQREEIERMRVEEKALGKAPSFDRYLNYDEIMGFMDEVAVTYSTIASIIEIGTSLEGRPIRVLKLSNGPGKVGIFFDTVLHAREWIGPPTSLYAINELTENLANNQALLDANDWYFLLIANPDGFVFSWDSDRFWRKNRNPNDQSFCLGVDLNRNFDYSWIAQGTTCDLTYSGAGPTSEPELQHLTKFLLENPSITGYIAVHSYGQYLLHPYGDTTQPPPNEAELARVAIEATDALTEVNGTPYVVGSTYDALYNALGISVDWAYDKAGIPLAYTIELRGDSGGFDPPASIILPSNIETWEAYKILAGNLPAARRNVN